jgi:hypothetical protein
MIEVDVVDLKMAINLTSISNGTWPLSTLSSSHWIGYIYIYIYTLKTFWSHTLTLIAGSNSPSLLL